MANNEFWKKKSAKKRIKRAYDKQNIKKINFYINEGYNISELLGFDNLIINCVKDNKIYLMKFFLVKFDFEENLIIDSHKFIKENKLDSIEKIFLMYTGEKNIRKKDLIKKYKKVKRKTNFL